MQAPAGNGVTINASGISAKEKWNIYCADSNGIMRLQNSAPLEPSAVWTMPASGIANGAAARSGQEPDGRILQRRVLPRG
jgi:hypothetical protein